MNFLNYFFNKKTFLIFSSAIILSVLTAAAVDIISFRNYIKSISPTLAIAIIDSDDLAIQVQLEKIYSDHDRNLIINTFDNRSLSASIISSELCLANFNADIIHMGISVANMKSCVKITSLIYRSITSKFFFLAFSLIQFFGFFYLLIAKTTGEDNLINLIYYLENTALRNKEGQLIFKENSQVLLKLTELFESRETANKNELIAKINLENEKIISNLAKQVSHDIRGPVTALNFVISKLENLEDPKTQLIIESTKRISEIANDLLSESRKATHLVEVSDFNVIDSIDLLIREFQIKYRVHFNYSRKIDMFLKVKKSDFERVLANIFQNSIEATSQDVQSEINIDLEFISEFFKISISDKGHGFDNEVLVNFGKRSISKGKSDGNGLGLMSAFDFMKKAGGRFEILNMTSGAQVNLYFPIS